LVRGAYSPSVSRIAPSCRIETCSRNNICSTCCTSASFIKAGISSSTTAGEVCLSSLIKCLAASRVSSSSACLRTVSVRCVAITAPGSTTV
jgi:hypothetical protein